MPCDCSYDESCPSCDCTIELSRDKCKVKRDCVLKVANHVQSTVVGNMKLYVISLVVKNCTKETLSNFGIQLDLKCGLIDFPCITSCDSPATSTPAVGILTADQLGPNPSSCLVHSPCVSACPYPVNAAWDGIDQKNLLDVAKLCNARVPPGETCFTIRFFTPATASLISPCVTISAYVPCCGPLRQVVMLKGDCAPTILDRCEACFVGCDLVPQ